MPTRQAKQDDMNNGLNGKKPDPTANVMALVEAAVNRLDDLHAANMRRIDEQLESHIDHAKQLADAEAKRIDAIRAVDVGAAAVDREKATAQAAVLATQVLTSAETLRTLVASTAQTQAQQQAQLFSPILDRLSLLEKSQYESKGRSGISAPLLMMIAGIVGAIISFLVQRMFK
jgi:hypothetical protein